MIILGVIKGGGRKNLGGDLTVARISKALLVLIPGFAGCQMLLFGEPVNTTAVLGAHIVALTHALGRIVSLPKQR